MNGGLAFISPASGCGFSGTGLTLFRGDIISLSSTFAAVSKVFVELLFLFQQLIVSFLANCRHFISFLLAGLARGLILPFLYVIIVVKLLLLGWRGGFFEYQFYFDFFNLHLPPFYRQLFNLLPLLLCFYYSTLVSIMSRDFLDFFALFNKSFPQIKGGYI